MKPRTRLLSFTGALLLLAAGVLLAVVGHGIVGEAAAIVCGAAGAIALIELAFLEVGFSEDRDRERSLL